MHPDFEHAIAKFYTKCFKKTDVVLENMQTMKVHVLWMLCIVNVAVKFAQLVVKVPRVIDCALMVGNAHGNEIKVYIDSGASHHFISDARLFTPWNDGVSNIIFNTATGVPITSRAVGTLKFLVMDVHQHVRVVALEHAYHVRIQHHNLLSINQLTKQQFER